MTHLDDVHAESLGPAILSGEDLLGGLAGTAGCADQVHGPGD